MNQRQLEEYARALETLHSIYGELLGEEVQAAANRRQFRLIVTQPTKGGDTRHKKKRANPQVRVVAKEQTMPTLNLKGVRIDGKPRKDGRWQGRITKNGTRKYIYGATPEEVQAKILEYLHAPPPAPPQKTEEKVPTYGEYLDRWLELYKRPNIRQSSYKSLKYAIQKHIIPKLGSVRINKITTDDLQALINNVSSSRQREVVSNIISSSMKHAQDTRVIKANPALAIVRYRHTSAEQRALTHAEQAKLESYLVSSPDRLLFSVYIYSSCRRNEGLAIRIKNIDLQRRLIYIDYQVDMQYQLAPLKSAKSRRYIPIPQALYDLLAPAVADKSPDDYLLPRINPNVVSRRFAAICTTLDIPDFSLHGLRHNWATRCEEAGVRPKLIQAWMGHSTLAMTLNRYTHISGDQSAEQISQLDTIFDTSFSPEQPE